jgi:Fic family protein
MGNDTKINDRQKNILKQIVNRGSISRAQLDDKFSRITAIRDLNYLVKLNLIKSQGKGRATKYFPTETNPSLFYIDMADYFTQELDLRHAKTTFDKHVFDSLLPLFSSQEKSDISRRATGFFRRGKNLDPAIYKRELERFVIEFSWKSSQIEGNTYDLLETETLIKQSQAAAGHSREETIMILNHKDSFDSIVKHKQAFQSISFTDILQLHNLLTKGLGIGATIRSQPVAITGTLYRPMATKTGLEAALKRTIEMINTTDFPPEKALLAASLIAYIQPFADGNKRTARNLANAILLAHDYFPLSYRNVDVNDYRRALIIFYEQNNIYHLKRIFSEQLEFSAQNYFRI